MHKNSTCYTNTRFVSAILHNSSNLILYMVRAIILLKIKVKQSTKPIAKIKKYKATITTTKQKNERTGKQYDTHSHNERDQNKINNGVTTFMKKDNSPRGCGCVSASAIRPGDKIVIDNYFTLVIE